MLGPGMCFATKLRRRFEVRSGYGHDLHKGFVAIGALCLVNQSMIVHHLTMLMQSPPSHLGKLEIDLPPGAICTRARLCNMVLSADDRRRLSRMGPEVIRVSANRGSHKSQNHEVSSM